MARTRHSQAPVAFNDPRTDSSGEWIPSRRPTTWLRGVLALGLLAAFSAPTPAHAEITEPERALLGRDSAGPAARGPLRDVARTSVLDGEAALLNKRGVATLPAGRFDQPKETLLVDGARALLNSAPGHSRPAVGASSTSAPGATHRR